MANNKFQFLKTVKNQPEPLDEGNDNSEPVTEVKPVNFTDKRD